MQIRGNGVEGRVVDVGGKGGEGGCEGGCHDDVLLLSVREGGVWLRRSE